MSFSIDPHVALALAVAYVIGRLLLARRGK